MTRASGTRQRDPVAKSASIIGLIPARGYSKGIPRKNLATLAGKPLIQYTFEAALGSKALDRVILSTEDKEIAELGKSFGIEVPFTRPKSLATDKASTWAVLRHALKWLEGHEGHMPEVLVTLQPTSPIRQSYHIDEAVREFQERDVDSVVSVTSVSEHPYEVVGFANGEMFRPVKRPKRIVRRQQYPPYFFINGAVYVTRSSLLLERNVGHGERVYGYVMDTAFSVDIDTPLDLQIAECLLRCSSEQRTASTG